MATTIGTKEKFLELVNSIPDGKVIIVSTDMQGQVAYSKKFKTKNVEFAFNAELFKGSEGVGDIIFGKVRMVCFAICDPAEVSEKGMEIVNKKTEKDG